MKKLEKGTKKKIKIDLHDVPYQAVCDLFRVSAPTLGEWVKQGCPRNSHGSYDLVAIMDWRNAQDNDEKRYEEIRKLQNQNALLEAQIEANKKLTIPREKVERVAAMQIAALREFLTEGCMRNVDHFINKRREELIPLFKEFARAALNKFVQSGVNADDVK